MDRLVIVETPARSAEETKKSWPRTERNYGFPIQTLEEVAQRIKGATPELLTRWNIDRSKAGSKTMIDVMWALREYDVVYDMPKVTPKSLLIFGERGPTIDKVETFRERIPHARLEIMQDCGHFPMLDAPDQFVAIVSAFLAEEAPRAEAAPAGVEAVR
jgi:pimeloyl-ACP methyl ester carboxylesterase